MTMDLKEYEILDIREASLMYCHYLVAVLKDKETNMRESKEISPNSSVYELLRIAVPGDILFASSPNFTKGKMYVLCTKDGCFTHHKGEMKRWENMSMVKEQERGARR